MAGWTAPSHWLAVSDKLLTAQANLEGVLISSFSRRKDHIARNHKCMMVFLGFSQLTTWPNENKWMTHMVDTSHTWDVNCTSFWGTAATKKTLSYSAFCSLIVINAINNCICRRMLLLPNSLNLLSQVDDTECWNTNIAIGAICTIVLINLFC